MKSQGAHHKKKSIRHYKMAIAFSGIMLILFLMFSTKDSVLTPKEGCWKDSVGTEISKVISKTSEGSTEEFIQSVRILQKVNCSLMFNASECLKYNEKMTKNGIDIGEDIRIGPKEYLGSY